MKNEDLPIVVPHLMAKPLHATKMKKYETLYKEFIDFYLKTKIWKTYSGLNSIKSEVESFETKIGCKFGESMNTYLQIFGNGNRYNGGITMYNYQNIQFATDNLKKRKVYDSEKIIKFRTDKILAKSFREICCINYIDSNGYFTLVNSEEENPNLFGGEAYDLEFDCHNIKFVTSLRNEIFLAVKTICNNQKLIETKRTKQIPNANAIEIAKRVVFNNYRWTNYYQNEYRKTNNRFSFNKFMESEEEKSKSILGFEEYELKYIEYQKGSSM